MGYMALLRNLRNFDQAGVSDEVAATVAAQLADPDEVARSRQLPMRFLSAYRAAPSLRWAYALETGAAARAGERAGAGRPHADAGRHVRLDEQPTFSRDGTLRCWDAAAVFGLALARRCAAGATWCRSPTDTMVFPRAAGRVAAARRCERFKADGYFLGRGTDTARRGPRALRAAMTGW